MSKRALIPVVVLAAGLAAACRGASAPAPIEVRTPNPDVGADTLAARRTKQIESARGIRAFHDFQFTDKLPESGITFVHRIVDDAGRHYKADEKGPDGAYVGLADASLGHTHPDRFEYPALYRNLGHNRFKDVTADVGLHPSGWGGDASVADVNGDGWPDLFVLNMQGHGH